MTKIYRISGGIKLAFPEFRTRYTFTACVGVHFGKRPTFNITADYPRLPIIAKADALVEEVSMEHQYEDISEVIAPTFPTGIDSKGFQRLGF